VILLINDDGIEALGLRTLYHQLRRDLKQAVLAVAPSNERSGMGHAITLNRSLHLRQHYDARDDFFGFAVDGTPTDCCKLGLKVLAWEKPRLVISGINDGPNVGRSLFYSGTVGAALEAAVEGHRALAVSLDRGDQADWQAASALTVCIAEGLLSDPSLRGTVANLNVPALPRSEWGGLRIVRHGLSGFREDYSRHQDSDTVTSWRLHGQRIELSREGETDAHALRAGHPTLTLLQPDLNGAHKRLLPIANRAAAQWPAAVAP
jgi:5'-nucleotidase